jgi:hypothetical protein
MRLRSEPLPAPVGRRYVRLGFEGGEAFTFRRPGLDESGGILGRWERAAVAFQAMSAELHDLSKRVQAVGDGDPADMLTRAQELAEQLPTAQVTLAAAAGFVIGRCWADPLYQIDAVEAWAAARLDPKGTPYPLRDGGEPWVCFGLDVYAELVDHLGSSSEVMDLAATIHRQTLEWQSGVDVGTEVKRKAKVFPAT